MTVVPVDLERSRYGLKQVLRSEVVKLSSLRSTWWTLLATVVGTLGVTALTALSATNRPPGWYQGWRDWFDPTNRSLTGLALGVLAIGVLGVLAATSEYGSGTIRSSLAAAPRRPLLFGGKLMVAGILALAVSEALTFASFFLGQAIMSGGGAPSASLGQPGVLRAVALSGAFVALLGILGVALGVIIRHTAGAIGVFVGVTFLLPLLAQPAPGDLERYLPITMLANSVGAVLPQHRPLTAPVSFGLMAAYTVGAIVLAAVLFVRRDA
jgi:hypothetical protein